MADYRLGEASTRAIRKIRTDQLELPSRPVYSMPTIPPDITAISAEDLMELFVDLNSWTDYVEVQFAAAQVDEKYEEQQLEEIRAREQINAKAEDVTTKKAISLISDKSLEQREKVQQAYGYRKITETIYNRLERGKFIVSRELTRRTGGSGGQVTNGSGNG